jgi:hypothetical protein
MHDYKYNAGLSPSSPEISRSIAIVEAVDVIFSSRRKANEEEEVFYGPFNRVVNSMADAIVKFVKQGDDLDLAVSIAMREYRSSKHRNPEDVVERKVRELVADKLANDYDEDGVDENLVKGLGLEEAGDFYHPDTNHSPVKPYSAPRGEVRDVSKPYLSYDKGDEDNGRETFSYPSKLRQRKLTMSEDGGEYIEIAFEPKLAINPRTLKGNCIGMIGVGSPEEGNHAYPVRIRFQYDDAAGEVSIVSILDMKGTEVSVEMDGAEEEQLRNDILDEILHKGQF